MSIKSPECDERQRPVPHLLQQGLIDFSLWSQIYRCSVQPKAETFEERRAQTDSSRTNEADLPAL